MQVARPRPVCGFTFMDTGGLQGVKPNPSAHHSLVHLQTFALPLPCLSPMPGTPSQDWHMLSLCHLGLGSRRTLANPAWYPITPPCFIYYVLFVAPKTT